MTANDSDVSDGDILTGSQVVRVYGENLTAPFVTLTFGDVEYTPLGQGEDYIEFIMTDNGTAIIAVDGSQFMSFEVEGIVTPTGLSGYVNARLAATNSDVTGPFSETIETGCLNFSHMVTDEYPFIRIVVGSTEESGDIRDVIVAHNCSFARKEYVETTNRVVLWISPIDTDQPCYLTYEDFIFFVGNYTTD